MEQLDFARYRMMFNFETDPGKLAIDSMSTLLYARYHKYALYYEDVICQNKGCRIVISHPRLE